MLLDRSLPDVACRGRVEPFITSRRNAVFLFELCHMWPVLTLELVHCVSCRCGITIQGSAVWDVGLQWFLTQQEIPPTLVIVWQRVPSFPLLPQLAKGFPLRENPKVQLKVLPMQLLREDVDLMVSCPAINSWTTLRESIVSFSAWIICSCHVSLVSALLCRFGKGLDFRTLLDLFQQHFDGFLCELIHHWFFELRSTEN